jgi:transposase InsO family protein
MVLGGIDRRYRLRVRERLAVLEYANDHGIRATARRFGLNRKTVKSWCNRYRAAGVEGLVPRYPRRRPRRVSSEIVELIAYARRELRYGSSRTKLWLKRVHHRQAAIWTIQRVFRDIGVPRLQRARQRKPRQLKLFEKEKPGDSVQVDVKVVKIGRSKAFQYTAIDDHSRYRVLKLYPRLNQHSSVDFLGELQRSFPFPIRRLQCDNGTEFPLAFSLAVQEAGIRHRYIRPRRPQQNGKVERSHRIDAEEFWARNSFTNFTTAAVALKEWERVYNFERFSMALNGYTPFEKLSSSIDADETGGLPGSEALALSKRCQVARASITH